ncbi:MAG: DNA replication and repair protein RecF [Rikenellaceae bacterium]
MQLKSLSIVNFKNIAQADIELCQGFNAFIGSNGAGKSNMIDAIHYLALTKSMSNSIDSQNINHGKEFFLLDGVFSNDSDKRENIVCSYSRQRGSVKSVKRNGKAYDRLSDHVGVIPVVVVSPQESMLITEASDERRRFLNSFISQIDTTYLTALIRYNVLLQQRNTILRLSKDESMLDIYDAQIAPYAQQIHAKRSEIITQMQPLLSRLYSQIAGVDKEVTLEYKSQLNDGDFVELLQLARQKDLTREHSTVGVHRDDLILKIGGYPLRKYGSQGEQKSSLIALKLSQYELLVKLKGERATLLLDDLFDKLDATRVERLISLVSTEEYGQIFITDCHGEELIKVLEKMDSYKIFDVESGVITPRG